MAVRKLRIPKGKKRAYTTTNRKAHGTKSKGHWRDDYSYSQSSVSSSSSQSI